MSWFGFLRRSVKEAPVATNRLDIPLFPLGSVLFPGGILSLKVFEQRYLDMAADCLRRKAPFGICLIASGKEIGETATPYPVGTLAHVIEADMQQLGILLLKVRGGQRFRIISSVAQPDGLLRGTVELIGEQEAKGVPEAQQGLLPLLEKIVSDLGPEKMPAPHDFKDAAWVGFRLAEILPIQALAKQKLLELDDPVSRLEIIHAYLAQRQLVK